MKIWFNFILLACLHASLLAAPPESSPPVMIAPPAPRVIGPEPATTSTVMRTNSMNVLDDQKRLGTNDFVSFRVVEDRDNQSQVLRVNDNGQLEVPYVGLIQAAGRTSKELAYTI